MLCNFTLDITTVEIFCIIREFGVSSFLKSTPIYPGFVGRSSHTSTRRRIRYLEDDEMIP